MKLTEVGEEGFKTDSSWKVLKYIYLLIKYPREMESFSKFQELDNWWDDAFFHCSHVCLV